MEKHIERYGKVYGINVFWQSEFNDYETKDEYPSGYWLTITEHTTGNWDGDKFVSSSMSFHTEDKLLVEAESKNEVDYNEAVEVSEMYIDELIERFNPKSKFTIKQIS